MKKGRQGDEEESDVLKMVQEMDRAPRTPPVATGTSSVYCASATPSEMIGTPEVPMQGASFKILERYLSGGEDETPGASKFGFSGWCFCFFFVLRFHFLIFLVAFPFSGLSIQFL